MAPVYHLALAAGIGQGPIGVLNIGGVANVTWIGDDGQLIAFDTGPGNALIDDWVDTQADQSCDLDGALAAAGDVSRGVVDRFLKHDYFRQPPPKSLDRNAWAIAGLDGLSLADGAATLTACTAETIAHCVSLLPKPPAIWVVCGGGRHNKTMMRILAEAVSGKVLTAGGRLEW